jgi:hypothetical protein
MLELVAALLIDLSEQKLYAYDDQQRLLYAALVSTGRPVTPTPTGRFQIGSKYSETTLVGPDYRIPAVPKMMCLIGGGLALDRLCLHPHHERHGPLAVSAHGCGHTGGDSALSGGQPTGVRAARASAR